MQYLKIIFYGILAFIERNPLFSLFVFLVVVLPPIFSPLMRWVMLGFILLTIIVVAVAWWQIRRLKRKFEDEWRQATGGYANFGGANTGANTGFSGFGFGNGMRLEDFVRQMQNDADARQQGANGGANTSSESSHTNRKPEDGRGEYVDFEEIE